MLIINKNFLLLLFSSVLLLSCSNNDVQKQKQLHEIETSTFKEKLIDANKIYIKQESDEIDRYVEHRHWQMITTGTGLRYMITKKGTGEKAMPQQIAKVNFKISLMDGTLCYTSDSTGAKEFIIEQDNVESGLHEGIQYMHTGDKATLILPSYLAHGLLGDESKIPSRASVIYELELVALRK